MLKTYAYETRKDLVSEKGEIKCKNIINSTKMFNFDYITEEDIKTITQIDHKFLVTNTEK